MSHTAYDMRLTTTNANIAKFSEIIDEIAKASIDGRYTISVKKSEIKLVDRPKLTGMLTCLGYEVFDADNAFIVSWLNKEPKK